MKLIAGQRGVGKTSKLIAEAARTHGTIVCKNVDKMIVKLQNYGVTGVNVVDYDTYLSEKLYESETTRFYIRNIEELLYRMKIYTSTITVESVTQTNGDNCIYVNLENPM